MKKQSEQCVLAELCLLHSKKRVQQAQFQKAQRVLIQKAFSKFGVIYPCGKAKSFTESFTKHSGILVFWFNTEDGSTHVMQHVMQQCVYDSN